MGWASDEFKEADLGDKRLNDRLIKLCDSFSESPESPINKACEDWSETKAAYRFFQNDRISSEKIMKSHYEKTLIRANEQKTVLAIQDTSYFVYTRNTKTKGLGKINSFTGTNVKNRPSKGLLMHTCLAVTTDGVPLGHFDQNIFARKSNPENLKKSNGGKNTHKIPLEEKESYKWVEALQAINKMESKNDVVSVCDRECDFYDYFNAAQQLNVDVLVRATHDRKVNRNSSSPKNKGVYLLELIKSQPKSGSYILEIPEIKKTTKSAGRIARTAEMEVKHCAFTMNPPTQIPQGQAEKMSDIKMYAIYAVEKQPPEGEKPVSWMLLTNQTISTLEEACERVQWYSLRWRIEMYFKVLKSGFRVEECRLGTAERLISYLSVMSIVAWRLFMITLIARTEPTLSCEGFLSEPEWKTLQAKYSKGKPPSDMPPTIGDAVTLIARLGGYLNRNSDPAPGTLVLWRGWKRLVDLTEGWLLANSTTYG